MLEKHFLHNCQKVQQHVSMGHCSVYLCVNRHLEIVVHSSNLMCKLIGLKMIYDKRKKRMYVCMCMYVCMYVCMYHLCVKSTKWCDGL